MQRKSNAVVFLAMTYPWGGIRHFALLGNEIHKIQNRNFDFYVASISREPDRGFWNTVRSEVPSENIIETSTFPELVARSLKLAECYNRVIIHTGGGWGQTKHFVHAIRHLDKSQAKRISLIGTTHAYRINSWMRIPMSAFQYVLYRFFYRMIVFQCQYAADRFVGGNDLIRRGNGVVIPLGCEPFSEPSDVTPRDIGRMGLGEILLNKDLFKFVYLAAFRPGKMHAWLVRTMAPVLRAYDNARVILCGQVQDDNAFRETQSAILEGGLQDRVILPGAVPRKDVPWLLQHVNCAIVPSRAETFGHNFLEPMFAGIPVLGTKVGVGCDLIVDGETGYVFDLDNRESLCDGMRKLMENRVETQRMGLRARQAVQYRFTHEAVARQLSKLYENLFGCQN